MKVKLSGRSPEGVAAIQQLADFLQEYGEVLEKRESVLAVDDREMILVAYSSQAYFERKGYYWFSLAKTKYAYIREWSKDHSWMVLVCGTKGRYFIPFGQIESLLDRMPSNRRDGRWDLYIRFERGHAYFGVTEIKNHLDVTEQLQYFEQIWQKPAVDEVYVDEAIYIPDSLPEPDRRTGRIFRVVRDTLQSQLVKELYSFKCQICGWTVFSPRLKTHYYCEAHHVQPLGKRYKGPDHISNILALCPTHHCMMDLGVLAVDPKNLEVLATDRHEASLGRALTLHRDHGLNQKYLGFHLDHIYLGSQGSSEIRIADSSVIPL